MSAELGHAALWMAAALAVLQLIGGAIAQRNPDAPLAALVRPAAALQGVPRSVQLRNAALGIRDYRSIREIGCHEFAFDETSDLQVIWRLG